MCIACHVTMLQLEMFSYLKIKEACQHTRANIELLALACSSTLQLTLGGKHVVLLCLLKQIIEQSCVDMSSPQCLPENSFFFPHSLSRN